MKRLALLLALMAAPAAAILPEPEGDPDVFAARQALDAGRYDLGLDLLRAVLQRLPGDPDVLVYVAFAERRAGRPEAAMAAYQAALAANPDHPGALAYQGSMFLDQGRRAEAEANLARLAATCAACPERETLAREVARRR
jgi:tetratricopeptide (TPR) repeat protein